MPKSAIRPGSIFNRQGGSVFNQRQQRYGVVSFKKGGHSAWDRMLRIGNQLHRHGLRDILNNPDALVAKLTRIFASAGSPQQASGVQTKSAALRCVNGQYLMEF